MTSTGLAQDRTANALKRFFDVVALGHAAEMAAMLAEDLALARQKDRFRFQTIHLLDHASFAEKLRLLRANGADINAQNNEGIALTRMLIHPEFLTDVLAAGADINLRDAAGETALMIFSGAPDGWEMVAAFLQNRSDVSLRDARGLSALVHAREGLGSAGATHILRAAGTPD